MSDEKSSRASYGPERFPLGLRPLVSDLLVEVPLKSWFDVDDLGLYNEQLAALEERFKALQSDNQGCFHLLFADDTTYQNSNKNLDTLLTETKLELEKAANWFATNKLSLNISKTKFMIFTPPGTLKNENITLSIGGNNIDRISNSSKETAFKFVGIWIDEDLSWSTHISKVKNKISSGCYALARSKNLLPINARLNIYNSLIKCHIEYGITAWSCGSAALLGKINTIHKAAIRHVSKKLFTAHTEPLMKKLKILNLNDQITLNRASIMFNHSIGKLPSIFSSIFHPLSNFNRTREFELPLVKSSKLRNSPHYSLIYNWNKINIAFKNLALTKPKPNCSTQINHTKLFKSALVQDFLLKYQNKIKCHSDFCLDCKKSSSN